MIPTLTQNRQKIQEICARYPVRRLDVFGSASSGSHTPERSDIDFLLDMDPVDPVTYKRAYFQLLAEFEQLLKQPIDLVTEQSIQNAHFRRQVDRSKENVYVR
jgi:predicted nucleotidyltransferase